jgi:alkyldihydroxyacetonephosphate synthase
MIVLFTYGPGTVDVARSLPQEFHNSPDVLAYPRTEHDIVDLFDWCSGQNLAVVPYGGGTSVVGGLNPPEHDRYRGVVSIDMKYLDKVLEVDQTSQAARIQAGVLGPSLERQLKPTGLNMRFFLQAWEFPRRVDCDPRSGHFATAFTQIDDHIESLRVVTPQGNIASRRFPVSGSGPNPDRLFLGSEGALGHYHAGGSLLDVSRRCSRGYEENQLRRISVPARGHTSGDSALSPVHAQR